MKYNKRLFTWIDRVSGRVKAYYLDGRVVEYDSLHRAIIESRKK